MFLFTLLLLNPLQFLGQLQHPIKIRGKITSVEKTVISNATISLLNPRDSAIVKIELTNETGLFEFDKLLAGNYLLSITSVGYSRYYTAPFVLKASDSLFVMPVITLKKEDTKSLGEVIVVAKKPFIERKIDRTVVNVDALISNAGTSAMEVLEKSPGVTVDVSGNISLRGKQGVVVFINDRPTYMSAADLANYLKSLPSSTLELIEIMTNPPAKYEASGTAGVINIKLKKVKTKGFNGTINTSYGQGVYMRTNNGVNFNYRINNVNLFSNISYNIFNEFQDLRIQRTFLKNDGSLNSMFTQRSYIKKERSSQNYRLGLDYYASKKSTLGFVINGFINPYTATTTNDARVLNGGMVLDSTVEAKNKSADKWRNGNVNVNYAYKFNNSGRELTFNADYVDYRFSSEKNFLNNIFLPGGNLKSSDLINGDLPATIGIRTAKVDYTHPLKGQATFAAGAKTSMIRTNNTAEYFNSVSGVSVINNDLTNYFRYRENINAVYVNFNKESKRFSFQSGLRLENTSIRGRQLGNAVKPDSSFSRKYLNLFPTIYLSYRADSVNRNQFNFSYGHRIDRPDYQDMNPFVSPVDKFTYFSGNPFLQPSFSHTIELSHAYKNTITTTLQYTNTVNIISETIEQTNGIFTSRPGNVGKRINFSASVSVNVAPVDWLSIQFYTELNRARFKGILYNQPLDAKTLFSISYITNQFKLSKTWAAELLAYYQSTTISSQFVVKPLVVVIAGIQKKIWKEMGSVKLSLKDIFSSYRPQGTITNLSNSAATFFNYLDNRVLTLSFTYRFNTGKGLAARQTGGAESEQNRVKSQ